MSAAAPVVVVSRDPQQLAESAAARLAVRLHDAQSVRGIAHLVLTGGGVGTAVLAALRAQPARKTVDWRAVHVWWGDERFVATDDPERNEGAARAALLDALDLDPAKVHPMAATDGPAGAPTAEVAADRYADALRAAAPAGAQVPAFDVLLLGIGPEGHIASIFPDSPAAFDERPVLAVHGCPKPPPTRVSMGFSALTAARDVWLLVSGEQKAPAVRMALGGAGRVQLPAAGAVGRSSTLWLLDEAAAADLPDGLRRL